METIFIFLLLASLLGMLIQDWKYRKIHVVFPVIVLVASILAIKLPIKLLANVVIFNMAFFLFTLGVLMGYMTIKNKQFLNPFTNYFGLGDFLFYIAIVPLFLLKDYVLFFILSLVFTVVVYMSLRKMMAQQTIPLAGFASLLLIFVIISDVFFDFHKMTLL